MSGIFNVIVQENPTFVQSSEQYALRAEKARDEAVQASDKSTSSANKVENLSNLVVEKVKVVEAAAGVILENHEIILSAAESATSSASRAESAKTVVLSSESEVLKKASEVQVLHADVEKNASNTQAWKDLSKDWADKEDGPVEGKDGYSAKYWANQTRINVEGVRVETFNGRHGIVLPQSGDYTAAMVGAEPVGSINALKAESNPFPQYLVEDDVVTSFNGQKGDVVGADAWTSVVIAEPNMTIPALVNRVRVLVDTATVGESVIQLDEKTSEILVKDVGGSAGEAPIKVVPPVGWSINGREFEVLDKSFGFVQYVAHSGKCFITMGGSYGGGSSGIGAGDCVAPDLSGLVPNTRKINGMPLTEDITIEVKPDLSGLVPTTRKINGMSLTGDITLNAASVSAVGTSGNYTISGLLTVNNNFLVNNTLGAKEVLITNSQSGTMNAATRRDYVDGEVKKLASRIAALESAYLADKAGINILIEPGVGDSPIQVQPLVSYIKELETKLEKFEALEARLSKLETK